MLRIKIGRRAVVGLVGLAFMAALVAPTAFGHRSLTPAPMIGTKPATKAQLAAGKTLFVATCSACHTLKAAGALGNIGPVLDKVPRLPSRCCAVAFQTSFPVLAFSA
jgi:cytochrome c5